MDQSSVFQWEKYEKPVLFDAKSPSLLRSVLHTAMMSELATSVLEAQAKR